MAARGSGRCNSWIAILFGSCVELELLGSFDFVGDSFGTGSEKRTDITTRFIVEGGME